MAPMLVLDTTAPDARLDVRSASGSVGLTVGNTTGALDYRFHLQRTQMLLLMSVMPLAWEPVEI